METTVVFVQKQPVVFAQSLCALSPELLPLAKFALVFNLIEILSTKQRQNRLLRIQLCKFRPLPIQILWKILCKCAQELSSNRKTLNTIIKYLNRRGFKFKMIFSKLVDRFFYDFFDSKRLKM